MDLSFHLCTFLLIHDRGEDSGIAQCCSSTCSKQHATLKRPLQETTTFCLETRGRPRLFCV